MTTDEIESGKALFLVKSTRVYRPEEVPPAVQEKACEKESQNLDPSMVTDSLVDSYVDEFKNRGIEFRDFRRKGRPEIYWTTYPTAVGLSVVVTDLVKFVKGSGIAHDAGLLARIIDSGNGPDLSTVATGRDGCITRPDAEYSLDEPGEIALAQAISDAWTDYVEGLVRRMRKSLDSILEYEGSWDCIKGNLEANEMGVDSEGNWVSLSECRTEGSGYNVGD